jgi:hypothetical protein
MVICSEEDWTGGGRIVRRARVVLYVRPWRSPDLLHHTTRENIKTHWKLIDLPEKSNLINKINL